MQKQGKKGFKKILILGTLALALSVPAGAASAAGNTANADVTPQHSRSFSVDLNGLLQQYMQGKLPFVVQPIDGAYGFGWYGYGQVPAQPSQPSPAPVQPAKPAPVQPGKPVPVQPAKPAPSTGNTGAVAPTSQFAAQVVSLVNKERAKAGLKPLNTSNATLTRMALDKAKDIYHKNYFDHNSPTYGSPFDMMKQYGIKFSYAGENIAKGQRTPQEVMTAWMNSSGHRANILKANYTTIGVAYYNGVWVQEFIA